MYHPFQNEYQSGFTQQWGVLVNKFLRPPRSTYDVQDLGGPIVTINGTEYSHQQIKIPYNNNIFIDLSFFKPAAYKTRIVILYLHANSSSRMQMESLYDVLPPNYSIAGFDFLSCGNVEDLNYPFVSYGVFESKQVQVVARYLESLGYYVILWGRSMGAISALKFGGTQVIVADSACASIKRVARQQALKGKPQSMPSCMVGCLFPVVYSKLRSDINNIGGFDVNQLNLKKIVATMSPDKILIFLSGDQDDIIDSGNSSTLYQSFTGPYKQLLIFKGTHNSSRPKQIQRYIIQYIESLISRQRLSTASSISSNSYYFQ